MRFLLLIIFLTLNIYPMNVSDGVEHTELPLNVAQFIRRSDLLQSESMEESDDSGVSFKGSRLERLSQLNATLVRALNASSVDEECVRFTRRRSISFNILKFTCEITRSGARCLSHSCDN